MNRINPFLILLLLLALLAVVIWQDRRLQGEIVAAQERLVQLERLGKRLASLKNYWGDRKLQERRINQFTTFAARFVKKKERHGRKVKLYLAGIGPKDADRIVSKLLNSFLKVGTLKIETAGKGEFSMEVELLL